MKNYKGYTLIEVLVSMVIFSVLITLAVSSYRYFFSSLGKNVNQDYKLSLLTQRKIMNVTVKSLEPYYFMSYESKPTLFFYGTKTSVSFISYSPSYLDEPLVISTLFITDSNKELRYCERALGSLKLNSYVFRTNDCPESKLYFEGENIDIAYFGWENALELSDYYSEYLDVVIKPEPKWRNEYNGAEANTLPLFIKITHTTKNSLLPKEFMFELPEELPGAKRDKSEFSG
jgi:prepilin-type N-terminal cleavage/methylation domain-containing protein